ncbi:MAG: porin family protein [Bacteroidales bacterium]|nr:porin family protein [Bacteroidales bacterium]
MLFLFNNLKTKTMKKFFGILAIITLFTAVPAAAQFNWGIKAGVNLAQKPSDIEDVKGKTGWFVGPMAKFTLPIVGLGLEANLLYSQSSTEVQGETIERKTVDLPVYLRYEFSLPVVNKFLEPFLAVGPQWSWNVGDKTFSVGNILAGSQNFSEYTLRSSNLSLNLGLGAIVLDHIQVHANYNIALGSTSDYREATDAALNLVTKSKTNTWQVSVAYIF